MHRSDGPFEQQAHAENAGSRSAQWCFWLLACLAGALGLAHAFAPLVDFPQHCLQAAIIAHAWDASEAWRDYAITDWFVPYQVVRMLHAAMLFALPGDLAMRLILLLYLLGMPLAARSLGQRLGATSWAAPAVFVVLIDANFLWGFLPHCVALPILFIALARFIDLLEDFRVPAFAWCTALGVLLFFTHPIVTGVYLLSASSLAIMARLRAALPTRTVRNALAALVPALLLLCFYLLSRGWLDGSVLDDGRAATTKGIAWTDPLTRIASIGSNTGFSLQGGLPAVAYLLCALALALLTSVEREQPDLSRLRTLAPYVLFGVWLCCFLLLPERARGERLAPRFASLVALGVLWLPWPPLRRLVPSRVLVFSLRATVAMCAVLSLYVTHRSFARFSAQMEPMREVIARVPEGAKVASLIYDPTFVGTQLPAFAHVGAYITSERGGLGSFMFTRLGIDYAPGVAVKRLLLDDRRSATRGFHLPPKQARYFDYVLVKSGSAYRGHPAENPNAALRRVLVRGSFELWERRTAP